MKSTIKLFKYFSVFFIIVLLIVAIFINEILIVKYEKLSYVDYLKYTYGYINYPKTIILLLLSLIIEFTLLSLIIHIAKSKYKYFKVKVMIMILLIILLFIIIPIFILFYLPQHCAFNLCSYDKQSYLSIDDMKNKDYISFIGIGDIQLFLSNDFKNRNINILNLVKKINLLVDKIKNNDNTNIRFKSNSAKTLFNASKNYLIGVINPGDLTQASYDGRFLTSNELGLYEYLFNLSPADNGLSNFYNYEILGNHDYQSKYGDWPIDKLLYSNFPNNSKSLINRRNIHRKYIVNKDENGNYSCDFGNLHIIFINLHLLSKDLDRGKPKTNLKFLENDLNKYSDKLHNNSNSKMRWGIVTHDYNHNDINNIRNVTDNYNDKLLMILSGHKHYIRPKIYKTDLYNIILPSPTDNSRIMNKHRLLFFVYNNKTSNLDILEIRINSKNEITISKKS